MQILEAQKLHLQGLEAFSAGDLEQAAEIIETASKQDPQNAVYQNNLGVVYRAWHRYGQAADCYHRALKLKPDYVDAHVNLSAIMRIVGQTRQAIASALRALDITPCDPQAMLNLALAYHSAGSSQKAAEVYERLIQMIPDHPTAHYNIGVVRMDQGRAEEAVIHYRRALKLRPKYPEALYALSNALRMLGRLNEAVEMTRKALRMKPDLQGAASHLAVLAQSVCDWDGLKKLKPKLDELLKDSLQANEKPAVQPLFSLWSEYDPATRLAIAASCSRAMAGGVESAACLPASQRRKTHACGKLIVGYLSNDFRNHPVGQQVLGLLRYHNRDNFIIHGYSCGVDDRSPLRRTIRAACDEFIELDQLDDQEAAVRIREDGVDILVELNGHTAGNRLGICARRPAPIQVSYLGFPGTTGAKFIDYFITDRIVTPPEHQSYYSERFVYVPHCFMVTDDSQQISDSIPNRSDAGLSDDWFVFSSFNNFFKIDAVMFSTWMNILQRVARSVLWLPGNNPAAAANLRKAAGRNGIDPDRLVFAPKLPSKADHLVRLKLADLALDTHFYNGHVSTCDALWAGLPVLTLMGDQFPARVSTSMLLACGVPELVTHSLDVYEEVATRLAGQPAQLLELKAKLARNLRLAPLFDTLRFVRHLEEAYRAMWSNFSAGQAPRTIEVMPNG